MKVTLLLIVVAGDAMNLGTDSLIVMISEVIVNLTKIPTRRLDGGG